MHRTETNIYNRGMLSIRHTRDEDLEKIEEIFSYARKQMALNGNPGQWKNDRPSMELVKKDIVNRNSYVIEDEEKEVVGTFAWIQGIEPTYLQIDGKWLDDAPYGTIHRIAASGKRKGIFEEALRFAERSGIDIRIDTHKDNVPMLHLIEKHGFERCGIIIVDDGTPRIAFQKKI